MILDILTRIRCKAPDHSHSARIQLRDEPVEGRAGPECDVDWPLHLTPRALTAFTLEITPNPTDPETMTSVLRSSSTVVGGLGKLTPMKLMPERYSRHMQTVTKLKQIRSALVSSVNGSYTVDVYTPSHSTSRIPTSFKAATKGQHLDAHMDKKYSDFMRLRDKLYKTCKESHSTMDCPFCSEVAHTLLLRAVLPGSVMSLVLSQHQQTKAVQRFIDSLLQLAASCPIVDSDACPCQKQLPQLLFTFLFGESDPVA